MSTLRGPCPVGPRFRGLVLALLLGRSLLGPVTWAATPPFTQVYAFGSELTATSGGPYANGRWCNGPIWVEHLSTRLGLNYTPEANRASGGSDSARILSQVMALPPPPQAASALFVVMPGLLDFGQYVGTGLDDSFWDRQITRMIDNTAKAVDRLYLKGARRIGVVNLPDLTRFPQFNTLPDARRSYHREKAVQHNAALEARLEDFSERSPETILWVVDFFSCLDFVLDHPTLFELTRTDLAAWHDDSLLNKDFDGPGSRYAFWDYVHPTSAIHALLAQTMEATILGSRVLIEPSDPGWAVTAEHLRVGVTYQLEQSDDLGSWTAVHLFDAAPPRHPAFDVEGRQPNAYYRLRTMPSMP